MRRFESFIITLTVHTREIHSERFVDSRIFKFLCFLSSALSGGAHGACVMPGHFKAVSV